MTEGDASSGGDRTQRDLKTLQAHYAHWERGDFGYTDAFAEDVVWNPVDALEAGEYTGIEQMRASWRTWLQSWESFRIRAEEIIPCPGGKYVVEQLFRGTGKTSGVESEERATLVMTMREGKIARMDGYWDRDEALRAAGISP